jgi:hypothetical protein
LVQATHGAALRGAAPDDILLDQAVRPERFSFKKKGGHESLRKRWRAAEKGETAFVAARRESFDRRPKLSESLIY